MKYIIIKRALKEKVPTEIRSYWEYHKIPSGLWEVWNKREISTDTPPESYHDKVEQAVENYSKNYPLYYWDWEVETDNQPEPKEEEETTAQEETTTLPF